MDKDSIKFVGILFLFGVICYSPFCDGMFIEKANDVHDVKDADKRTLKTKQYKQN